MSTLKTVDCNYLSCMTVKIFESFTEEYDFSSVSASISKLSTSSDNWLNVSLCTNYLLSSLLIIKMTIPQI